jgi:hypothetical protein
VFAEGVGRHSRGGEVDAAAGGAGRVGDGVVVVREGQQAEWVAGLGDEVAGGGFAHVDRRQRLVRWLVAVAGMVPMTGLVPMAMAGLMPVRRRQRDRGEQRDPKSQGNDSGDGHVQAIPHRQSLRTSSWPTPEHSAADKGTD